MVKFITQRFIYFIIIYFILQVIIRLFTTNIAVLDESEQVMLTQYFSLGYNEQPPLYTWLQMGIFQLTGVSIFGLSLLKNTFLCLTYIFTYLLGMLFTNDNVKSSLSALSLFLLPQMVWDAQIDQTHTVFLTSMASMTVYLFFYILIKKDTWFVFALLGFSAGIGLLAKYNFVLVIVALGGMALYIPEYRKIFYSKKLLLSIIIAICIVLPHFLWFISHLDIATNRTVERMSVGHTQSAWINFAKGISDLFISFIAFLTPFWLFFIMLFRKTFMRSISQESKVLIIYLGIIFSLLFMMVALSGTTHIKERWLQPYLVLVPLLLFLFVKPLSERLVRYFVLLSLIAPFVVAMVVLLRPWCIDIRDKPMRTNYPFVEVIKIINSTLPLNKDVLIYAEDKYLGGNLKLLLPSLTVITPSLPNQPYVMQEKIVVMWDLQKPEVFLKSLDVKGYSCQSYEDNTMFQKSKKISYKFFYEVCYLNVN